MVVIGVIMWAVTVLMHVLTDRPTSLVTRCQRLIFTRNFKPMPRLRTVIVYLAIFENCCLFAGHLAHVARQ